VKQIAAAFSRSEVMAPQRPLMWNGGTADPQRISYLAAIRGLPDRCPFTTTNSLAVKRGRKPVPRENRSLEVSVYPVRTR